jgi:DNA-binding XRE family transcriptional regulator
MGEDITKVMRNPRTKADIGRRSDDANHIRELRNALQFNREAFARACGVSRISALAWEAGKTSPQPRNWKEMAKLAVKAAPSTALWFWEKAGIEREDFQYLFPEFERLARDSERRIQEKLESPSGDVRLVPIIRTPLHGEWRVPPSPEQVEDYLSLPGQWIRTDGHLIAMRVSPEFILPVFGKGDILVIDPSQTNILELNEKPVVVAWVPDAGTRAAAESDRRGVPVPEYKKGKWPHLAEGVYVGWLSMYWHDKDGRSVSVNVESAKFVASFHNTGLHQFSLPIATLNTRGDGMTFPFEVHGAKLLGHVVCWIAASTKSSPAKSGSQED